MGSGPVQMKLKKKIERPPQKDALNWTGPSVQFKLDRTTGSPDWSGPVQMKLKKKIERPPLERRPQLDRSVRPVRTGPDHLITGLVQSGPDEIEKKIERPPLERCPQLDRSVRPVQTGLDHWITGLVRSGTDEIEKKN